MSDLTFRDFENGLFASGCVLGLLYFTSLAMSIPIWFKEVKEGKVAKSEKSALENEVTAEQNYQVGEQVTLPARLGSAPQKYSVNKNSDGSYCFTPETQRAESDYNTGR